jgi:predicted Fe-Mo cluster-binding NifX family protein
MVHARLQEKRLLQRTGLDGTKPVKPEQCAQLISKETFMKIAISSQGQDLSSGLDPRFGRTPGFIIYDTQSGEASHLANTQNMQAMQGAGIQTAQNVVQAGAEAVITGHVGPKAFSALQAGGIDIYLCQEPTVQEAIKAFEEKKLTPTDGADKPGHW